jgi:hypothetical protein
MGEVLEGAIAATTLFAGLFFYRFWRQTRDRFFLCFAGAFWIEGASRAALALHPFASEQEPVFYVIRLLAYGLIILAIWQKNRQQR